MEGLEKLSAVRRVELSEQIAEAVARCRIRVPRSPRQAVRAGILRHGDVAAS
jgi:hypothetical protein